MNVKIKKMIFVCVAVVLVASTCAAITVISKLGDNTSVAYVADPNTQTAEVNTAQDTRNILFLGLDNEAGLCDVMMLVNINFTSERVTVAQIPRDTYAEYTESSYKKLNGAYSCLGGAEQTALFLSNALGIDIHHYVCINLDTFGDIVNAVGGVDVELPCDMRYSDREQGLYINLKKGSNHLDGDTAQQFVRFRSGYVEGDLGRIDAQKLFMAALLEKLSEDFSPVMAVKLTAAIEGVETDLEVSDMLSIGTQTLGIRADNMYMLTLAGSEAVATESGASYYALSAEANAEIMREYFGAVGEFDTDKKFLNSRYESFKRIYSDRIEYSVRSVGDIMRNGVDISVK